MNTIVDLDAQASHVYHVSSETDGCQTAFFLHIHYHDVNVQ